MAFTAGKSKEIEGKSNDWLLDQSLMQSMQDRFCDANNVYMVCLNAQNGVVTKAYGTKEELEYVYSKAGRERHVSLLDKMTGHSIESVVEEPLDTDFIKMSGVAIHVSGETIAVWIVIGIMDDSTEDIPNYMMRTSPERYYKSLEFLEKYQDKYPFKEFSERKFSLDEIGEALQLSADRKITRAIIVP